MKVTGIGDKNRDSFRGLVETLLPGQQALGLIEDERAIGAAVFSADGSTLLLEYIYVSEAFRRRGGGTLLLEAAAEAAGEAGIEGIMTYFEEDGEIRAFLEAQDFVFFAPQQEYSFAAARLLASSETWKLAARANMKGIVPAKMITRSARGVLVKLLRKNGYNPDALTDGCFDPELSFLSMDHESPNGILLAQKDGQDIAVTMFVTADKKGRAGFHLVAAFAYTLNDMKMGSVNRIRFVAANQSVLAMLGRLLPREDGLKKEKRIVSAYRR